MKTKILAAALAFFAATTVSTLPAQSNNAGTGKGNGGTAYVDKNNNGVCDNYENGVRQGNRQRQGKNATVGTKKGCCKQGNRQGRRVNGYGNGYGKGNGRQANFVDANVNGICDHRENTK